MITRPLYLTLSLGAMLTSAALAGDNAAEVKTAGYHLKNQSTFEVAPGARAPFWPIGWRPTNAPTTQNEAPAPVVVITPEQFAVTSISVGSYSFALIDGRTYGVGDYLRAARPVKPAAGAPAAAASTGPALPPGVRVRVIRILDGQVILQAGTQAIAVPLRRATLSEKKPGDEDLLSLSDR
ncbi:MAG TPA: hypothetical protein VGO11_21370 [Chthoniobacteraceae bacterium]|jgi:hypothetical protein|nr:hypothetical protein [Chthoniobacteraceae bacterium]